MEIKMVNTDKVSEENKKVFFEYMEKTSKEFHDEAYQYLDKLYSIRNVLTYRPSSLLTKYLCYICGCLIMTQFTLCINDYINMILHGQNLIVSCIFGFVLMLVQIGALCVILYQAMLHDKNYRHTCYLKFKNSDCVKKYENNLLKKAEELNIELEIIDDEN